MKWFDPERGLGVIAQDSGGFDAVVCRSAVRGDAERVLGAGKRVCFDVTQDAAGVRADNVSPMTPVCCASAEGPGGDTAVQERAGWLAEKAPGIDAVAVCPWCVQSGKVGVGDRPLLAQENASSGPAVVFCGGELVRALWAGMAVLAVVTIAAFALSIVVTP
ncbi:cold shock domain-containing protein [Streptomyces sp. NPDC085946]|uniref:cold shock domain-containing protein n=1 Tax=Streptomyces sp. NPDC085946 TaxID=3365744 RepID=UPI0037D0CAB4